MQKIQLFEFESEVRREREYTSEVMIEEGLKPREVNDSKSKEQCEYDQLHASRIGTIII